MSLSRILVVVLGLILHGCGSGSSGGGNADADLSATALRGIPSPITLAVPTGERYPYVITMLDAPEHGYVQFGDGATVTYTSLNGFFGDDTFRYRIVDAVGATREGTVTVTVDRNLQDHAVLVSGLHYLRSMLDIMIEDTIGSPALNETGRYVAIAGHFDLVHGGRHDRTRVYRWDRQMGTALLVSVTADGVVLPGDCTAPAISADGQRIAFVEAPELASDKVWVKDLTTGTLTLASSTLDGQVLGSFGSPTISADGMRVLFSASEPITMPNDDPVLVGGFGALLSDLNDHTITVVTATAHGTPGDGFSLSPRLSANGLFAVFTTGADNLRPAGSVIGQIMVKNLTTGALIPASTDAEGNPFTAACDAPQISGDGRLVMFTSTDGGHEPAPGNGVRDVFLKDLHTGALTLISADSNGNAGNGASEYPALSSDGRQAMFRSSATSFSETQAFLFARPTGGGPLQPLDADPDFSSGDPDQRPTLSGDGTWGAYVSGGHVILVDNPRTRTLSLAPPFVTSHRHATGSRAITNAGQVAFLASRTDLTPAGNGLQEPLLWSPDTGVTRTVVVTSDGDVPDSACTMPDLSHDGAWMVYASDASNLDPALANGQRQIWLSPVAGGPARCVSRLPAGAAGDGESTQPYIAANGGFVAYTTLAENLVDDPQPWLTRVVRCDLADGTLTTVDIGLLGVPPDARSEVAGISADGRLVAFLSLAGNLVADDTNGDWDAFVADLDTGTITCLSVLPDGSAAGGVTGLALAAAGGFAAFSSSTDGIVVGDANGVDDVFRVALSTGVIAIVSVAHDDSPIDQPAGSPQISADGRRVAFWTASGVLADIDDNGTPDVYVKDLENGQVVLVTRRADGSAMPVIADDESWGSAYQLSPDGSMVAVAVLGRDVLPETPRGSNLLIFSVPATGVH